MPFAAAAIRLQIEVLAEPVIDAHLPFGHQSHEIDAAAGLAVLVAQFGVRRTA